MVTERVIDSFCFLDKSNGLLTLGRMSSSKTLNGKNGAKTGNEGKENGVVDGPRSRNLVASNDSNESVLSNTKGKVRKSVFRIKVGCVVAVRFRMTGNMVEVCQSNKRQRDEVVQTIHFDDNYTLAWTEPMPGRDENYNLIGKRIRCFLPKVTDGSAQNKRVLEGEIIQLVIDDNEPSLKNELKPFNVELLIDKSELRQLKFLQRVDEDIDVSQISSSKGRKNFLVEEAIRGKNKAIVQVTLEHPFVLGLSTETSLHSLRWVLLKRIPFTLLQCDHDGKNSKLPRTKKSKRDVGVEPGTDNNNNNNKTFKGNENCGIPNPSHNTETKTKKQRSVSPIPQNGVGKTSPAAPVLVSRYCGDANDSAEQQISNWRWLASRYFDISMTSSVHASINSTSSKIKSFQSAFLENAIVTGGLIGQVDKINSSDDGESSLALVSIRRLILPEQTVTGRLPNHKVKEAFTSFDEFIRDDDVDESDIYEFRVPVEHLVIISHEPPASGIEAIDRSSNSLVQTHSYSLLNNTYTTIRYGTEKQASNATNNPRESSNAIEPEEVFCHRCRRYSPALSLCSNSRSCLLFSRSHGAARWCTPCIETLTCGTDYNCNHSNDVDLPCCMGLCECRVCTESLGSVLQSGLHTVFTDASTGKDVTRQFCSPFEFASRTVEALPDENDFWLPSSITDIRAIPAPSTKVLSRARIRKMRKLLLTNKQNRVKKQAEKMITQEKESLATQCIYREQEDYSEFKETCARIDNAYNCLPKQWKGLSHSFPSLGTDMIRNLREHVRKSSTNQQVNPVKDAERISSSRAARATQRRLLKDVASFGASAVSNLGLLDALSNREPQLRFDRSSIHAWGVFADEDIAADELIIEYRGELIENAMAEKREKVYEAEKIGSDYMFRIDADIVCDATKQGNVARFINASCEPNCYTKIIFLDGTKRIVIYAKRDISVGEELCYDYKFPIEYDEKKRIPCHCGSRDCRGFMNWVSTQTLLNIE
jgi:SET domain